MRLISLTAFLALLAAAPLCPAADVQPVPVGKGSYASGVPAEVAAKAGKIESEPLYLVNDDGRPLPSNHWWTQLLVSKFAKSLWTYPMRVETGEKGLDIAFPIKWASEGNDPVCDVPLTVTGKDFKPADARAKDWSDWLVSFRMAESPEKYMDVTLGEGMPSVWIEFNGVQPVINLPAEARVEHTFFDASGKELSLPATADCIGIQYRHRQFGIFGPDGTKFSFDDGAVSATFSGKGGYLVVCALPAVKDMPTFHKYAYAIPRDSQMSWKYDAAKGVVNTTWTIKTEPLKGTEKQVIQGWIPHHYHGTTQSLKFAGLNYLSPRGELRCTIGNEFVIGFPYTGIVPNLPAPAKTGGEHAYDENRMKQYLKEVAAKPEYGGDTYWGGKDIQRLGQCALMAQQIKDENSKTFVDALHTALADWYTWTPGEKEHFFARYNKWKALVGISPSYGSEGFNDHHFHYGYFTFASALLSMYDPAFASDYGAMATLVAKDYANWDRNDKNFPLFRTFDIWAGHSWAGGTSSPGGNNQESSSEAVQSWAGLIFLGQALGDKQMTDAGIMGYATESHATMEYWFNESGDVFPPEWKHPVTGMVWSGGKVYGTYFTGDPAWVYGIQWLPASPMLSYLVHDPAAARKRYEQMCDDFNKHELADAARPPRGHDQPHVARTASIETFGPALGSVMLGYVLMYDPNWVAAQLDDLYGRPDDKIAHDPREMTVMYYQAHSMKSLGLVDWTCHGSSPTSMVYRNDEAKSRTYIVWNPRTTAETVTFYDDGKSIGQLVAAPQSLTSATTLTSVALR